MLPITDKSKVLDTSCGSGGFLLYALDKVRKQADAKFDLQNPKEAVKHYHYWHTFAEKKLFGIEINEQIARTAKMNMIIHDDGHTNVIQFDGLFPIEHIDKNCNGGKGNNGFEANSFDFVITNPPFGSIIKQSEKSYLKVDKSTAPYYDFALKNVNWIEQKLKPTHLLTGRENQATEILFLEQIHKFLKTGGYTAVVIPDGILTNSSLAYVRESLEEKFRIVAVVSLPQTAFTHTGAGVKSSVLLLKKHSPEQSAQIKNAKTDLQNKIAKEQNLSAQIAEWDKKRKDLQKANKKTAHLSVSKTQLSDTFEVSDNARYLLSDTSKVSDNSKQVSDNLEIEDLNEKIENFKEELEESYQSQKAKILEYPIFMAIAENIGYDATGKTIAQNDLDHIATELSKFIQSIEKGTDSFFL